MNTFSIVLMVLVGYVLLDILFFRLALAIVGSAGDLWETPGPAVPTKVGYSRWEKITAWVFGLFIVFGYVIFVAAGPFLIALWHLITRGRFAVDLDYPDEE